VLSRANVFADMIRTEFLKVVVSRFV
jgi:hypothetical protein